MLSGKKPYLFSVRNVNSVAYFIVRKNFGADRWQPEQSSHGRPTDNIRYQNFLKMFMIQSVFNNNSSNNKSISFEHKACPRTNLKRYQAHQIGIFVENILHTRPTALKSLTVNNRKMFVSSRLLTLSKYKTHKHG